MSAPCGTPPQPAPSGMPTSIEAGACRVGVERLDERASRVQIVTAGLAIHGENP